MTTQRSRISLAPLILACAVGVAVTTTIAHAQPCGGYQVTAIIHPPECPPFGIPPTTGTGISDPIDGGLPNVVGYYQSCTIGPDTAFLWIGNEDRFVTLPMPPGTTRSNALGISGSHIVGSYDNPELELGTTGFLYDYETDQFTSLGTLPGGNTSESHNINNVGEIVGFWGNNIIGPWQAFIWEDGVMKDLGPSIGGANNRGLDINDNGAITGWWQRKDNGDRIAFVWQDRVMTDLGPIPGGFTSEGHAINSRGDVTGWGKVQDFPTVVHGFVWNDGEMVDIGTLPGFESSTPRGINDAMQVVGAAENPGKRAFLWQDGVMMDINDLVLPDLGLNIKIAWAINLGGQITGQATGPDGIVALVLTPTGPRLSASTEPPVGNLDDHCTAEASDLLLLLASWGLCENCQDCAADFDQNCAVGISDLLILLANWG